MQIYTPVITGIV